MEKFILANYNVKSQEFVKTWIGVEKVICVKQDHCRKDEHYVFYEGNDVIRICKLTLKGSINNGSCFWGDLTHLAKVMYCNVFGFDFMSICYWYDRQKMKRIEKYISNFIGLAKIV